MTDFLDSGPLPLVIGALFLIALARGQAVYWVGRSATSAASRRWDRLADSPRITRGRALLSRWGLPVVPLAYLTIGLQSVVFLTCGVVRLPWARFALAQVPGALAWAAIYGTVGLAAWQTAVAATVAGHPGAVAAAVSLVGAVAVLAVLRRRRQGAHRE